jgi:hypothetical protein
VSEPQENVVRFDLNEAGIWAPVAPKVPQDWFWKLPRETQDEILHHVHGAMKWRGWDECDNILVKGDHARQSIQAIATLLWEKHKIDVEQYT